MLSALLTKVALTRRTYAEAEKHFSSYLSATHWCMASLFSGPYSVFRHLLGRVLGLRLGVWPAQVELFVCYGIRNTFSGQQIIYSLSIHDYIFPLIMNSSVHNPTVGSKSLSWWIYSHKISNFSLPCMLLQAALHMCWQGT